MRVAAIVLTYRPDAAVLHRALASICTQVEAVVIVDNGAGWDEAAVLGGLSDESRRRIEVLWLPENMGVGAGHNRGIDWARERGFTHVLILDHDSIPRPDMVRRLAAALEQLTAQGAQVAAVGPQYVDRYTGNTSGFVRLGRLKPRRVFCPPDGGDRTLETDFVISSGALIPLAVIDRVGPMNEGFFIDHVDTEWIFRAKAKGYRAFGACDAVMEHSLGLATFSFWFGRRRTVPLHSPERNYYIFRNGVALLRMAHAPRRWIVNDIVRLCAMAVFFPLLAPHRLRRVRLMALGVWHGLRGRSGPLG